MKFLSAETVREIENLCFPDADGNAMAILYGTGEGHIIIQWRNIPILKVYEDGEIFRLATNFPDIEKKIKDWFKLKKV